MSDLSGSMTLTHDAILGTAALLISRLLDGDRVRAGSFSDRIMMSPDFTSDHSGLASSVRKFATRGYPSNVYDAVIASLDALATESQRRVVVLLTDGDDQGSRRSLNDVTRRAQSENTAICAIGVRPVMPPELMLASRIDRTLKKLTADTGGCYAEALTPARLPMAVDELLVQLHTEYLLGFTPTVADNKLHAVKVAASRGATATTRAQVLTGPVR